MKIVQIIVDTKLYWSSTEEHEDEADEDLDPETKRIRARMRLPGTSTESASVGKIFPTMNNKRFFHSIGAQIRRAAP